jgi:hypothetical protein
MYAAAVDSSRETTYGGSVVHADAANLVGQRLGDRFQILRLVGVGAHGAVYEAVDEEFDRRVALKTLLGLQPEELFRFKHEFRTLSDASDPRLVTLYELFVSRELAFFTMEFVEGTDLLSYVRPGGGAFDEGRLRQAMRELALALSALHSFGRVHCDLKPSNVLVDRDGRVRLADFGLARELGDVDPETELVGTPAYMSPEQAAAQELDTRSDWYSVGVMLYEALTQEFPFGELSGMPLLMMKQVSTPTRPSQLVPELPPDLDALCMDLLAREPQARPEPSEVLARLGTPGGRLTAVAGEELFIGRENELARLGAALGATRDSHARPGRPVVTFVRGRSGMGKTALLRRFVRQVRENTQAVVLAGRCYERESVPYKGLDVLIDALRRHLAQREVIGEPRIAVDHAGALARMFPVLGDAPGFVEAPPEFDGDPFAVRQAAMAALREILAELAARRPLVVHLDDLQWCDRDSARLLVDLMRPSTRPALLMVLSYRSEDVGQSAVVRDLLEGARPLAGELAVEEMEVKPLPPVDAVRLARSTLLGRPDADHLAEVLAAESEGSPLFVSELARYVLAQTSLMDLSAGSLDLETVIRTRMGELPPEARQLLDVVSVAGRPLPQGTALAAAGLGEAGPESVAMLRSASFVRTRGGGSTDAIEPYHDRIAKAVRSGLDPFELRNVHRRLAERLERAGADAEDLAYHLEAAGDAVRAAENCAKAAESASRALAFDRAARLFRKALRLLPEGHSQRSGLRVALADALAHDGRGGEAGEAYLEAARDAAAHEVVELRRRAAEQLLRSGRVDEGLVQLRRVLTDVGIDAPSNAQSALVRLLWKRLRIRLRGRQFEERPEAAVPANLLLRIDTCWAACTGLIAFNVVQGQDFQALHLLLALEAGEPRRVARALGTETLYSATGGEKTAAHTQRLLSEVQWLARRIDDPLALGTASLAAGVADVYRGRFKAAHPKLQRAETILRDRCTNVAWELSMARTFSVTSQYYLGDVPAMADTMGRSLDDAAARDDVHTEIMMRLSYGPVEFMAADELDRARGEVAECQRLWPFELSGPTFRYVLMLTQARIERYAGRYDRSFAPFEEHWSALRRSFMLSKQPLRVFCNHDRGCSAASAAFLARGDRRERFLAAAAADAKRLADENVAWASALASPISASVHAGRGDQQRALAELSRGWRQFVDADMALYAAAVLRRRGELRGGDAGARDIGEADTQMHDRGIVNPASMTNMLVPPVAHWE